MHAECVCLECISGGEGNLEKEGVGAGIKEYPKVLRKGVCGFMWKDSLGNAGISFVKMRDILDISEASGLSEP